METLFLECEKLQVKEIFTQAEDIDKHALAFYRTLGGVEEPDVTQFSYLIN